MIDPNNLIVTGAGSIGLESGALTGAGANAPVWSCRYAGTGLAIIERVALLWDVTTAFTAAQLLVHELLVARGFTASDTGGTAATLPVGMHRTGQPLGMADVRIAATAALTPGTRTLDANALAATMYAASGLWSNNTTSGPYDGINVYKAEPGKYPLILQPNEGLVINNVIAMGAAGVIKLIVNIDWKEVLNF